MFIARLRRFDGRHDDFEFLNDHIVRADTRRQSGTELVVPEQGNTALELDAIEVVCREPQAFVE